LDRCVPRRGCAVIPSWRLPGAVVDANESPFSATARAVRDELNLSVKPGRLLVVDWVPPSPDRIEGPLFVYNGATLSPDQAAAITSPPPAKLSGGSQEVPARRAIHCSSRFLAAVGASKRVLCRGRADADEIRADRVAYPLVRAPHELTEVQPSGGGSAGSNPAGGTRSER